MSVQTILADQVKEAVKNIHNVELDSVEFQATRKDFEGDITLVTFPMLRQIKTNPVKLGESIGEYLVQNNPEIEKFNVVQGFLNIVLADKLYLDFFGNMKDEENFGNAPESGNTIMVEYSSPNTNKPLH